MCALLLGWAGSECRADIIPRQVQQLLFQAQQLIQEFIPDAPADVDPALDDEFKKVFNKLLNIELHLVVKVCHPSPAQLEELQDVGHRKVLKMCRLMRAVLKKPQVSQEDYFRAYADGCRDFEQALLLKVREISPTDVFQRYQEEKAAREEYRRTAAVAQTMSIIDCEFLLTAEQLTNISNHIAKSWEPQGCRFPNIMYCEIAIPKDLQSVLPFLDPLQRQAWTQKDYNKLFQLDQFSGFEKIESIELDDWTGTQKRQAK